MSDHDWTQSQLTEMLRGAGFGPEPLSGHSTHRVEANLPIYDELTIWFFDDAETAESAGRLLSIWTGLTVTIGALDG